jgi:DNA repair protein RecO (recombination protein O)
MQWTDEGIVLGARRHGESSAIAELLTREHGRHLGLVRGGSGSRLRPILQAGNSVSVVWRARLDEHLGHYTVEPLRLRTATMFAAPQPLLTVTHLASLVRLLPERDPHTALYEELCRMLDGLDAAGTAADVARFELRMLSELGFGLDLSSCAATGRTEELVYVSPKSGRAVSRQAGAAWHNSLLRLPAFFAEPAAAPSTAELRDGFALTGFFLERLVYEPRGLPMPDARAQFLSAIARLAGA